MEYTPWVSAIVNGTSGGIMADSATKTEVLDAIADGARTVEAVRHSINNSRRRAPQDLKSEGPKGQLGPKQTLGITAWLGDFYRDEIIIFDGNRIAHVHYLALDRAIAGGALSLSR